MPEKTEIIDDNDSKLVIKPIILDDISYGTILLRVSTDLIVDRRNDFIFTIILFMLAIILFSYIFAILLQHVISRPILRLAKVTQDISRGRDYSVRVQKEGNDEIGKLYEGFNNMLEQIELRDQAVSDSEKRYRDLVEFTPVPIFVQSAGLFEYLNPAAVKLFDAADRDYLLKKNVAPLIHKDSMKRYRAMLDVTESTSLTPMKINTLNNMLLDVEAAALQLIYNQRHSNLIILLDVSKRKKAEDERKRLNQELIRKNKELEQVVYVTSHDLRSPLVNIYGFSKELDKSVEKLITLLKTENISENNNSELDYLLNEDIPVSLDFIEKSCSKMDALLSGLLRLSRLGRAALKKDSINMEQMLGEIKSNFGYRLKELNAELIINEVPECYGDAIQLNQVFSNLIDNAIKFLDSGRRGEIVIDGWKKNGAAVFTIKDNGIGIKKEHQEKVFEIFHRLNPQNSIGEGLGLSIIKKIIDRHNGKVWLESEPGSGTTFFISIPNEQSE
jgi:PAS domain S-box-containing protein